LDNLKNGKVGNKITVQRAKENPFLKKQEKGNVTILSSENAPHTTGAVHACAHTNTAGIF